MLDPTETAGGILSKQTIIYWIAIWPRCQEQHLHSCAKGSMHAHNHKWMRSVVFHGNFQKNNPLIPLIAWFH